MICAISPSLSLIIVQSVDVDEFETKTRLTGINVQSSAYAYMKFGFEHIKLALLDLSSLVSAMLIWI